MSTFKKDTVIESFPAYDIVDRAPRSDNGLINITHGDQLILRGTLNRYRAGSAAAYALQYNEDPVASYQREAANGNPTHWLNRCDTTLTAHEQEREQYVGVIIGQRVFFEGRVFEIETAPNDNLSLNEVGA